MDTKTYTHTGIGLDGKPLTKTVTVELRELSQERQDELARQTARDIAALTSYALSNPEVPVHD